MDLPPLVPVAGAPDASAQVRLREGAAREAAAAFEAAFLTEMLKHSGLNAMSQSFGGGAGEQAFGGFLTEEYARLLAERGGIGLAEQVFEILKQRMTGS